MQQSDSKADSGSPSQSISQIGSIKSKETKDSSLFNYKADKSTSSDIFRSPNSIKDMKRFNKQLPSPDS